MQQVRPIDIMRELGLLSWSSLLVGYLRQWATHKDVIDYAVDQLVRGADDPDLRIAQLAWSEKDSDLDVREALGRIAADHGQPVSEGAARSLQDLSHQADKSIETEYKAWRLAFLLQVARGGDRTEETVDRLEEIWWEFGYPDDMESVSRTYIPPADRGADLYVGYQFSATSFDGMNDVIRALRDELHV